MRAEHDPHPGDNGVWLTPQEAVELIARLKRRLNGQPEPTTEGGNNER